MTGYALNIAIGLQVIMGSLITGLSASSSRKSASYLTMTIAFIADSWHPLQSALSTTILGMFHAINADERYSYNTCPFFSTGGMNTLVAAYLARARGSNEPELSITRVKDLEQFIRECQAFQMDHGHVSTGEFDQQLIGFRQHFEQLLGNASG